MTGPTKTFTDFGIDVPNSGGENRYTTCPQCSSDRKRGSKRAKCLSVNIVKEVWKCHHCGWVGSLASGRARYDNDYKPQQYYPPERYDPSKGNTEGSLSWFEKRGITKAVVERNRIITKPSWMPQLGESVNAVHFPFYRDGKIINIKYRAQPKHFKMEAGAERIFYGLDDIDPEFVVIVEGEMDKLSLEVAGITSCISVPDGAPDPKTSDYANKFIFLENSKQQLEPVKHFVIAVDADEAGKRLEEELIHRLGRQRCSIAQWPAECKDANDTLLQHGVDGIHQAIYSAEKPAVEGVVKVRSVREKLHRLYTKGLEPVLHPGWSALGRFYRVSQGEFTVVTGIPGHGKSEFIDAMLINLAEEHQWSFAIFSPENFPVELHIAKLIEKRARKGISQQQNLTRMTMDELDEAAEWVNSHFHFIMPPEDCYTLDEVLEIARNLIFQEGIKGVLIDPWNELNHERPGNITETEHISRSLGRARSFTRKHKIHLWLVAHPTKLEKKTIDPNTNQATYPVPTPYDISGGAHWRNKADNMMAVYRPNMEDKNGLVEVHVQKIRFKKNGHPGRVNLLYDGITGRYTQPHM